uniref:Uncharacterized protein n=1 Tax=Apteryx owenii TaxID=8824 RepID=A0A8B9S3B6_APTOW
MPQTTHEEWDYFARTLQASARAERLITQPRRAAGTQSKSAIYAIGLFLLVLISLPSCCFQDTANSPTAGTKGHFCWPPCSGKEGDAGLPRAWCCKSTTTR